MGAVRVGMLLAGQGTTLPTVNIRGIVRVAV
jgi:hypothetical protein